MMIKEGLSHNVNGFFFFFPFSVFEFLLSRGGPPSSPAIS